MKSKIITLSMTLLFSLPIKGEEHLYEMNLEDLMKIKVSVASPKPKTIYQSPSIVSVFTRAQLLAFGFTSLRDALSYFTGVIVNDKLDGDLTVQVRGYADRANQKILFLLNDFPYWLGANGRIPIREIDIDSIARIEIIRGPSSHLWYKCFGWCHQGRHSHGSRLFIRRRRLRGIPAFGFRPILPIKPFARLFLSKSFTANHLSFMMDSLPLILVPFPSHKIRMASAKMSFRPLVVTQSRKGWQ